MSINGLKHCMSADEHISKLLTLSIYYHKILFHVMDEDGKYMGSLGRELLSDLDYQMLEENPTLRKACSEIRSIAKDEPGGHPLDISARSDQPIQQIFDKLNAYADYTSEIPLVDAGGRIVRVLDRYEFMAEHVKFQLHEDAPFLMSVAPKGRSVDNLNRYAYNINSQHGEDGILEKIIELIGTTNRVAVEFGGWDGIYLRNIRNLIVNHGFSGLFIEGDPDRAKEGIANYKGLEQVQFVCGFVGFKDNKPLDDFLQETNMPQKPDLISIDIDGYDYHVWSHPKKYQPRVVIIEFNPTIANDIIFIPPEREDRFMGSSALAMVLLGMSKGYSLAAVTQTNCIFVLDSEFSKLGILDNSLDALRPRETYSANYWMQSYDEHIYHTGDTMFYWSGRPFDGNQFHV